MADKQNDPLSAAGTALGAASLFLQVLQGCRAGFSLWKKIDASGTDALIFKVRLDMQAAKFHAWAFEWGLHDDTNAAYFTDEKFQKYDSEAVQAVLTIYSILADLGGLELDHPLLVSAGKHEVLPASSFANMRMFSDAQSIERDYWVKKMESIRDEARMNDRIRWVLENGKAAATLETVASMITDLYTLFPPPRKDPAIQIIMNPSLASVQVPLLDQITAKTVDDPLLVGLARLKAAMITMSDRANAMDKVDVTKGMKTRNFKESRRDVRSGRSTGKYQGGDALVEWKTVKAGAGNEAAQRWTTALTLENRIHNLARLLRSEDKPVELRTLPCRGVLTTSGDSDKTKLYGLVYEIPNGSYVTLTETLNTWKNSFYFEDRLSAATTLATAVLYLHVAGWLHKGIRGDNILFFADSATSQIDFTKPYLVGFEYSRENAPGAQTEDVLDDLEWNLYRHPDVQGVPRETTQDGAANEASGSGSGSGSEFPTRPSYEVKYDIYSLGIVLLEIGLMEPAMSLYEKAIAQADYGPHSTETFVAWVKKTQVVRLGSLVGRNYLEAVTLCLSGELAERVREYSTLAETLFHFVIDKLRDVRAR